MENKGMLFGSVFGGTAIIFGAFAAHALANLLTLSSLNVYETAVKYQMYHALFLLFVSLNNTITDGAKKYIIWFTTLGVFMFSGSLYLLSTNEITTVNFKFLGPVTPIGGLFLTAGWLLLLRSLLIKKHKF